MQGLDNLDQNMEATLESIRALPDQIVDAWLAADAQLQLPESYKEITNVVFTGMGGSLLGARLIEGVFATEMKLPLVLVNGYDLPGFVDENTLVVCSSYSGTTEETIENARQAIERKAKWVAMTTGGPLKSMAEEAGVPMYAINPTHNPSGQPRMAIGYSITGQLVLAKKLGLIALNEDMKTLADQLRAMQPNWDLMKAENEAMQLAKKMANKMVMLIGAEHMAGAAHTVKNQFNECAKHMAARFDVPELNHHLMEGLGHPEKNPDDLFFWLINSDLYHSRTQKRMTITNEVINKQHIETGVWKAQGKSKLEQAFEVIQFGSYVVFYLSVMNKVNPVEIPWVNFFKGELGKE